MEYRSDPDCRENEKLVEFVLEKHDISPTFELIRLGEDDWEKFTIGEYLFRSLGDSRDLEAFKNRMAEEYGYPPELEELLERSYARCLVIDDSEKIGEWRSVHEGNKQSDPSYTEHLAPHLDVFFKILESLSEHDFLIIYNQKKVEEFEMERVGIIEETFHYLHHRGLDVPIDHDEVQKRAEKILEKYTSKVG